MTSSTITSRFTEDRLNPDARIRNLERVCSSLWSTEPPLDELERTRVLRQLGDVERKIASLTLKLIVDPEVDTDIDDALCRCERRIEELGRLWDADTTY